MPPTNDNMPQDDADRSVAAGDVVRDGDLPGDGMPVDDLAARQALTREWVKVQPIVASYLLSVVNHRQDEEDLLQQVALSAAKHFDRYDPSKPFQAWALTIARNKVVDHFRKQGRQKLVFSDELLTQLADEADAMADTLTDQKRALKTCLDKLPPKSRQLVTMRYEQAQPVHTIAESAGLSCQSMYVTLHRIRKALGECIRGQLGMGAAG